MTNRAISQPWKEAEGSKAEMEHCSRDLSLAQRTTRRP